MCLTQRQRGTHLCIPSIQGELTYVYHQSKGNSLVYTINPNGTHLCIPLIQIADLEQNNIDAISYCFLKSPMSYISCDFSGVYIELC